MLMKEIGEINFVSAINRVREMKPKANDYNEVSLGLEDAKETVTYLTEKLGQQDTRINTLLDILAEQQWELVRLRAGK